MDRYPKRNAGLKLYLAFKASIGQLLAIVVFFVIGFTYFYFAHSGDSAWTLWVTVQATIFISNDVTKNDPVASLYAVIGSIVITQGVLAIIVTRVQQTFNPKKMAQILAQHASNHVIVLGFGHLGKLILEWCLQKKKDIVIIEKNDDQANAIVEAGVPTIVGDASIDGILEMAHVERAHDVVQTFNDVRTALVLAHKVHKLNPKCEFWVRCHDDKLQNVLAEMGAKPFSTSFWIFEKLLNDLPPAPAEIAIVGYNNIGERFAEKFIEEGRPYVVIDEDPANEALLQKLEVPYVIGNGTVMNTLRDAGVAKCSAAILCLDDQEEDSIMTVRNMQFFNPKIVIFVRCYDDEIAKVIEGMGARPFSSSKFAFTNLLPDIQK
ncbi:MAG TPA: NAD(P)-binding protein [Candidatus Lokiarchaeia archaeon]|nr:NAD(P)-binding protein [Candidatus Lokiarchaeia archaeon]